MAGGGRLVLLVGSTLRGVACSTLRGVACALGGSGSMVGAAIGGTVPCKTIMRVSRAVL